MSSGIIEPKDELHEGDKANIHHSEILVNPDLMGDAVDGENREHEMTLWQSVKSYPWACMWAFIMCFTIVRLLQYSLYGSLLCTTIANAHQVMESFDMFLSGNFVALPAFQQKYGVFVEGSGYTIPTRWQSALFQSGQCGAFIGVFLAGPITNRLGYRWTTILGLVLMNATIFISFFVSSTTVARPVFELIT